MQFSSHTHPRAAQCSDSGSWWTAWFLNDCLSSIYIWGSKNWPGASNVPVRSRTVASEPPFWHRINNKNKTLQSEAISRHFCWIAINCAEMNVSVIIGLCASVFIFFPNWSQDQLCAALMQLGPGLGLSGTPRAVLPWCAAVLSDWLDDRKARWSVCSPERAF